MYYWTGEEEERPWQEEGEAACAAWWLPLWWSPFCCPVSALYTSAKIYQTNTMTTYTALRYRNNLTWTPLNPYESQSLSYTRRFEIGFCDALYTTYSENIVTSIKWIMFWRSPNYHYALHQEHFYAPNDLRSALSKRSASFTCTWQFFLFPVSVNHDVKEAVHIWPAYVHLCEAEKKPSNNI